MDFETANKNFIDFYKGLDPSVTDRNEAATRLHLIDVLFFDCLGWNRVDCLPEDVYGGQYTDYSFGKGAKNLVVEAKKEGQYFELPEGFKKRICNLKTLFQGNELLEKAVNQTLGYCQKRGIPIGAMCNGNQLVVFIGSRQDGVPPLEGKALVFSSLEDIKDNFKDFWDNLSAPGVENYRTITTLKLVAPIPPEKFSTQIIDYPGFKIRNELQNELQILGGLFLEDINKEPILEEEFLKECYCPSGALSQYALVGRQILEARYSSLFQEEIREQITNVNTKHGTSQKITEDILTAGLSRRPIILLGEVGAGKSMFIRHFIKVEAADFLEKSLVIYIDFGKEPALPENLTDCVLQSCKDQLKKNYQINIEDNNFICGVYDLDLKHFRNKGLYSKIKDSNPEEFSKKEIEFLEAKVKNGPQHLRSCLEHISKGQKRQIIVFLDNIDQRPSNFQDEVFLIGHGLAEEWPGTVFISLRPDTFFHSKKKGSITGYQPRVFTISPPRVDKVISKRLDFALKNLLNTGQLGSLDKRIFLQSQRLTEYIKIIQKSFQNNRELIEFVDNASGGNIRQAIGFLTAFIGSGHVDTGKILSIYESEGSYTIPLHEFFRAVIYGDNTYYFPDSSPIPNIFDISTPDGKEHFLISIILMQVERLSGSTDQGYVQSRSIYDYCQGFGYQPTQIKVALDRCLEKNLLESNPRFYLKEDQILHYRITTVGAYAVKRMAGSFTYIDAVVVDTPMVSDFYRSKVSDAKIIGDRLDRALDFCRYLDAEWSKLPTAQLPFNWGALSVSLKDDIERIKTKTLKLNIT